MDSSSYALRPSRSPATDVSIATTAHSELGVHDSLRHGGPRALAAEAGAVHPLEASLKRYEDTQANLKLTLQRNLFGLHAPIRTLMEREIVSSTSTFSGLGRPSNLHLDILTGKDETLDASDVLGVDEARARAAYADFHVEQERRLRL